MLAVIWNLIPFRWNCCCWPSLGAGEGGKGGGEEGGGGDWSTSTLALKLESWTNHAIAKFVSADYPARSNSCRRHKWINQVIIVVIRTQLIIRYGRHLRLQPQRPQQRQWLKQRRKLHLNEAVLHEQVAHLRIRGIWTVSENRVVFSESDRIPGIMSCLVTELKSEAPCRWIWNFNSFFRPAVEFREIKSNS